MIQGFKDRRMFWIPVITGWIIFAFTLIYVLNVQKENNQFYQNVTNRKLKDIREIFLITLDSRINTLTLFADRWKKGISFDKWAAEINRYLEEPEGLLEMNWVSDENGSKWVVSKDGKGRIEPITSDQKNNKTLVTLEEYRPGIHALVLTIPSVTNGELIGHLKAVIDFDFLIYSSISRYLGDVYHLEIFYHSQEIYTYGDSSPHHSFNATDQLSKYDLNLIFQLTFNAEIFNISMLKNTFFLLTIGSILSFMIPSLLFLFYYEYSRNQVLQRLLNVKDEFLSNMSHEIRTPLNGVISNVSLLKHMRPDLNEEKCLGRVITSSKFLEEIVNNILDYLKLDSEKLVLEILPNDIKLLVYEVYDISVQLANEKGVMVDVNFDNSIPREIWCDSLRVKQVLMNLVNNAIKFTQQGKVSLRILCKKDQWITFEVEDTGIGISKDKQEVIFEKFVQADNSTTRRFGGTGLGLAICQKLVKAMGGKMGCVSEEGKGSIFWFEIPLTANKKDSKNTSSYLSYPNLSSPSPRI